MRANKEIEAEGEKGIKETKTAVEETEKKREKEVMGK